MEITPLSIGTGIFLFMVFLLNLLKKRTIIIPGIYGKKGLNIFIIVVIVLLYLNYKKFQDLAYPIVGILGLILYWVLASSNGISHRGPVLYRSPRLFLYTEAWEDIEKLEIKEKEDKIDLLLTGRRSYKRIYFKKSDYGRLMEILSTNLPKEKIILVDK